MNCDSKNKVFLFSKADIAALAEFACDEKAWRTHLACIHLEPEAGTAVATDGHVLVAAKNCGAYKGKAFNVPIGPLVAMAKVAGKGVVSVGCEGEDVVLAAGDATSRVKHVDHSFPPWRQVVPAPTGGSGVQVMAFDALLLARLAPVQRAAGVSSGRFTIPHHKFDALTAEFMGEGCTWTCIVMPAQTS